MSLVTTPTRLLRRCAACAGSRVTAITMTLTDGTEVEFVSCRGCEHRSWTGAGSVLPIDDVLTRARKIPAQKRAG